MNGNIFDLNDRYCRMNKKKRAQIGASSQLQKHVFMYCKQQGPNIAITLMRPYMDMYFFKCWHVEIVFCFHGTIKGVLLSIQNGEWNIEYLQKVKYSLWCLICKQTELNKIGET